MSKVFKVVNPEGITLLVKNNQPLSCPYQPAIPMQGKLAGQISFIKQPCSSNCPFFDDYEEVKRVTLMCKDVTVMYEEEEKQESNIKLL
jgi:hypothetical protein